jgi:hypothetical protein
LLTLLATQESIHRVLNGDADSDYEVDDEQTDDDKNSMLLSADKAFLSNFYLRRLSSHFLGRQRYGQAGEFLKELLETAPSMVQVSEDVTALIDPTRIAELLLRQREQVALEWKEIAARVPEDHMEIKRLQLNLLMDSYNKPSEEKSSTEIE